MSTVNILFLTAIPESAQPLDVNTELRQIEDALDESANAQRFRLFRHARLRRTELEHTLETFQPHIVHFSGHGSSRGTLFLEDHDGREWELDRDTLRTVFRAYGQSTRLAVLNACHSEVAGNMLREVVPYVIGNAIAVYDRAAVDFSTTFYTTLFSGETLHKSFRAACRTVSDTEARRGYVPQLLDTPHQPDPRQVKPLEQWLKTSTPVPVFPVLISPGVNVSRSDVRELLGQHLKLDAQLDAFALDRLPDVHLQWSNGMDRMTKVNILLTLHEPSEIATALAGFLQRSRGSGA